MTTEIITGLHKCQPKNTPVEGQIKTFVVIHMPPKGEKKGWIKIKGESEEKGGMPYRVLSINPTGWEPDDYGNSSYNLEIEPATSTQPHQERPVAAGTVLPYGSPPPSAAKPYNVLDERQRAIIRQHSQSMSIEILKLKVTLNELTPEDITPAKLTSLANYFDADVIGAAQHDENA